ncbi:transporter substrate-binding domain-containing protein [Roseibium salinum]|nr:transporter substrate-binding domain-containing protein [Roseibium salinum]
MTFAADSWCPVNCAPGSERPGYMVEIVEAILEPKGYDVRYVNVNWSRALLYARSGRFDAVLGALKGDAPDFVFPAEPQGETEIGIFVPKSSSWQYTSEASLKDKRIGLIRDYAYGEELERHIRLQAHPTYAGGEHPLKNQHAPAQSRADRHDRGGRRCLPPHCQGAGAGQGVSTSQDLFQRTHLRRLFSRQSGIDAPGTNAEHRNAGLESERKPSSDNEKNTPSMTGVIKSLRNSRECLSFSQQCRCLPLRHPLSILS